MVSVIVRDWYSSNYSPNPGKPLLGDLCQVSCTIFPQLDREYYDS